jgi:tetratricopeptide (TPR) repeat protein
MCVPKGNMPGAADIGPRFAERAADMLDRGDVAAALSVLLAGTKVYPAYATAHFLLGCCYERLGKHQEAKQRYAQVRQLVPGLPADDGIKTYGEEGENGVDFMLRKLQSVNVRRDPDAAALTPAEMDDHRETADPENTDATVPIVSATLAEIYAHQGRYREAVDAYSRLVQQRPAEAGRYRERIAELEKLLQGVNDLGKA